MFSIVKWHFTFVIDHYLVEWCFLTLWTSFPHAFASVDLCTILAWICCYCVGCKILIFYFYNSSVFINWHSHVKIIFPFLPSSFLEVVIISVGSSFLLGVINFIWCGDIFVICFEHHFWLIGLNLIQFGQGPLKAALCVL